MGRILENVQTIQLRNGLVHSEREQVDQQPLDFTIEMETGTGKTYVYLRSIMDMYQRYGFAKHIIVVPSIPIKEGVYKSLQMTKDHFKEQYNNLVYNYFVYDSSNLSQVRDFATNDGLEIMVINIDAFRKSFEDPTDAKKKANIIHRYHDKLGYSPIDLIRNTQPMVFIDEPQTTMSTDLARRAIHNLNPLALFRYSATHREKINLMYKLNAVDAYEKKLVKQIEVSSVQTQDTAQQAYIHFKNVRNQKNTIEAQLEFDALEKGKIKRKTKWMRQNMDLEQLANREEYQGFIVKDISAREGSEFVDFTSRNEVLQLGESIGDVDDLIIKRGLIQKTIEAHLDRELVLNPQGIKVLSLFFIDAVANYKTYSDKSLKADGVYAKIFEEEYQKAIKHPKYATLFDGIKDVEAEAEQVHSGYFAKDKRSKKLKDTKENREGQVRANKDDEETFNLIMKHKEKLLSFSSKLRFIFSHSALKEGWDNPNVFQICTLKEAGRSEVKRRQEIGRGLRLSVNQQGQRIHDPQINTLTVMATESYESFADNLQKEIEKETGIKFGVLEAHSFNNLVVGIEGGQKRLLGQEDSGKLLSFLINKGYVDKKGKVQDRLRLDLKDGNVQLPPDIEGNQQLQGQVLKTLRDTSGKLEVKNRDDLTTVKVNKQVLHSPEFEALWERVKHKTTYSVQFDIEELIRACISAIDERLNMKRGRLVFTKASLDMTIGGVLNEERSHYVATVNEEVDHLPDIITYLQNETNLTRKTLVRILTGTEKLNYFKINPQAFIESCIAIINSEMRQQIVDGIKYEKIGDHAFYSQELFKNEELTGYLKHNLKSSEKSPYEYVVYDSSVESNLVGEFEKSENVLVYAKLPAWFKIDTPLGTYNPDWVLLWRESDEERLYFVVETKDSLDSFDRRGNENAKIKCGKKHFEALGSRMMVAKDIGDVSNEALENIGNK